MSLSICAIECCAGTPAALLRGCEWHQCKPNKFCWTERIGCNNWGGNKRIFWGKKKKKRKVLSYLNLLLWLCSCRDILTETGVLRSEECSEFVEGESVSTTEATLQPFSWMLRYDLPRKIARDCSACFLLQLSNMKACASHQFHKLRRGAVTCSSYSGEVPNAESNSLCCWGGHI